MDPWASPWGSDAPAALPEPEPVRIVAPVGIADDEPWGSAALDAAPKKEEPETSKDHGRVPPTLGHDAFGASALTADAFGASALTADAFGGSGFGTKSFAKLSLDDDVPAFGAKADALALDPDVAKLSTEAAAIEENVWGGGDTIQTRVWRKDHEEEEEEEAADGEHDTEEHGAEEHDAPDREPNHETHGAAPSSAVDGTRDTPAAPAESKPSDTTPNTNDAPASTISRLSSAIGTWRRRQPEAPKPEEQQGWKRVAPPQTSTSKLSSWLGKKSEPGTPTTESAPGGILRGWRKGTASPAKPASPAPASPAPASPAKPSAKPATLNDADLSWLDTASAPKRRPRDAPARPLYDTHYDDPGAPDAMYAPSDPHELYSPELSFGDEHGFGDPYKYDPDVIDAAEAPRTGPLVDRGRGERYGTLQQYEAPKRAMNLAYKDAPSTAYTDVPKKHIKPLAPPPPPARARNKVDLLSTSPPPAPLAGGKATTSSTQNSLTSATQRPKPAASSRPGQLSSADLDFFERL